MISQRYLALSLLGLSSAFSVAGESLEPVNSISQTKTPDFMEKIKFSGDIRSRYEARDEDTFDASDALTVRGRLGLKLGEFNGFSAFIEGEGTNALVDDLSLIHI